MSATVVRPPEKMGAGGDGVKNPIVLVTALDTKCSFCGAVRSHNMGLTFMERRGVVICSTRVSDSRKLIAGET